MILCHIEHFEKGKIKHAVNTRATAIPVLKNVWDIIKLKLPDLQNYLKVWCISDEYIKEQFLD